MRRGVAARLLGVIGEVCLAVFVGSATDNLNRVFVCTHSTICTKTEEECLKGTLFCHRNLLANGEREVGNIVYDTNGELIAGLSSCEVLEYCEHLCGGGVLRRKTIATTDDEGFVLCGDILARSESLNNIEVQGATICTGLFGTVEHADALGGLGKNCAEVFHRERTVEVYGNNTHLLALSSEVVDALFEGLGDRTHSHDYVLSIGRTVVGEGCIVATSDSRNFLHCLSHCIGHCIVELVGSLTSLEVDIGVLCSTTGYGVLGVERTCTELSKSSLVEEGLQVRHLHKLYLLNLVRGTETIEEVEEGDA